MDVQALALVVTALAIGTVLVVVALLGLAIGVAAIPAVLASRTHPAGVLRDA